MRWLWPVAALATLLGLAAPVAAEDAECLAAPTRDCVLDMAVAMAEQSENRFRAAHGLLTVAVLREALGLQGAEEAGTKFIAMVLHDSAGQRDGSAGQFGMHVGFGDNIGFPKPFSDWLSQAPLTMARVAAVIWETDRSLSGEAAVTRDRTIATYLGLAGRTAELAALLESVEAAKVKVATSGAMGLLSRRDFDGAGRLIEALDDPGVEVDLTLLKINRLVSLGDFPQALTLTDMRENPDARLRRLSSLALEMTREGVFDAARVLADRPELQAAAVDDLDIAKNLAEVAANLGDTAKVAGIKAKLRSTFPEYPVADAAEDAVRLEAIAALVSGDDARFLDLARSAPRRAARSLVWWSANAALVAGRRDLGEVMEELPVSLHYAGLRLMAYRLAEAGELDAALATLDRLQALVGPFRSLESDPRIAIAPLLAKRGRASEAVAMALAVGDAALLASLAVDLPE